LPERGAARKAAENAIRRGVELGMTHIDTAEMYGSGAVEELVGAAIAGIARERLFIASKVLPSNASYEGTLRAAERSIARLRCGYLDLYMLHWPGSHPLEETMRALEDLVERGDVRLAGVSNFDTEAMLEAASYLHRVPLSCNQVLYNLCERGVEHELVPAARERKIAIVAYTPFGRGAFLRHAPARAALESVARKHGASGHQVALAFLTREPNVFTIPKAADPAHAQANASAADITLDADDVAVIDAAYPPGPPAPLATL
jgi:diketogulonate reductase-like aldo/keto reductase